jgi:hypothetical protein
MSSRTLFAALAGLLLAGGFVTAAGSAAHSYDFTGSWMTSEGIIPFTQNGSALRGTYARSKGRILATVTGHTAEGVWIQSDSVHRCTETKDGSHYWGRIKFTADPAGRALGGRWSYCGQDVSAPSGGQFTGRRR